MGSLYACYEAFKFLDPDPRGIDQKRCRGARPTKEKPRRKKALGSFGAKGHLEAFGARGPSKTRRELEGEFRALRGLRGSLRHLSFVEGLYILLKDFTCP